jgi:hypothetical protein
MAALVHLAADAWETLKAVLRKAVWDVHRADELRGAPATTAITDPGPTSPCALPKAPSCILWEISLLTASSNPDRCRE